MRLIDADALDKTIREEFHGISATGFIYFMRDKTPIEVYNRVRDLIDNTPTVEPQKIVTIPPELIEKLASCVVDIVGNIDWEKAIEVYKARPQSDWIPVSERLPDKEGEYLVTRADFDNWGICRVLNVIDIAKFDTNSRHNNGFHKAYEVIAWMPLPEAYKEEAKNDK